MRTEELEERLYPIFMKFIPRTTLRKLWEDGRTLPLTGALWDFDAIDMTYLFFEIERAFSIHIPPKMLEEYRFNSINGIISIIEDLLKNN